MQRILTLALALSLIAPVANAQYIDCSGGCTETKYGLGNPPDAFGYDAPNTHVRTTSRRTVSGPITACRFENSATSNFVPLPYRGKVTLREQNACTVSVGNRCQVELPDTNLTSGDMNVNTIIVNLGATGIVAAAGALFISYQGSVGFRESDGRCVDGNGDDVVTSCSTDGDCNASAAEECLNNVCVQYIQADEVQEADFDPERIGGTPRVTVNKCWDDAQCGAGESCQSTCAISGADCQSDADCSDAGDSCGTRVVWDGIGKCLDQAAFDNGDLLGNGNGVCITDGPNQQACPNATDACLDGFHIFNDPGGCACCISSTGGLCPALIGLPEGLDCPRQSQIPIRRGVPAWLFEGGVGTRFASDHIVVPNQEEGVCFGNRGRGCGTNGDLEAGAANGKCTLAPNTCLSDGSACTEDSDCGVLGTCIPACGIGSLVNAPLASACDDTAFGGTAGDRCDVSESGYRAFTANPVLADGAQNPQTCKASVISVRGAPEAFCNEPVNMGQDNLLIGGCQVVNFAYDARPDFDCDAIDDTEQGVCHPVGGACTVDADCPPDDSGNQFCITGGDLCPFLGENAANVFRDSNGDGIGDECQCGDTGDRRNTPIGNDGAITGLDIAAMALCANGALDPTSGECDPAFMDATGDVATTAIDIGGVVQVVNGVLTPDSLTCLGNSFIPTP